MRNSISALKEGCGVLFFYFFNFIKKILNGLIAFLVF